MRGPCFLTHVTDLFGSPCQTGLSSNGPAEWGSTQYPRPSSNGQRAMNVRRRQRTCNVRITNQRSLEY